MSSRDNRDHARLLVRKASEDEAVVRVLLESTAVTDAAVGFHAQQAVEKLLKAALALQGVAYPWTHDIVHLMELLDTAGSPLPGELADARRLTPWAAEFRYGESIDDELDRGAALGLVQGVRAWVEDLMAGQADGR